MSFLGSLSRKLGFFMDDNEEEREEEEIEETEYEEEEEEEESSGRFSFGFFNLFKRSSEEQPDEEEDDEPRGRREEEPARTSRRSNVIHDSRLKNREVSQPQYTHCEHIVVIRRIEEVRDIIHFLHEGESVMLNLENIDPKDCGRVVDLLSGAAFALQGRMVKVAHLSYLLAPENVEVIEADHYRPNGPQRYM